MHAGATGARRHHSKEVPGVGRLVFARTRVYDSRFAGPPLAHTLTSRGEQVKGRFLIGAHVGWSEWKL